MTEAVVKFFAMIVALLGPAPADAPAEFQLRPGDQVVAIGDSVTSSGGYIRILNHVLAQQYPGHRFQPIVNAGIGAQKSENLLGRFQKDVIDRKPTVVFINVGVNDVRLRMKLDHDEQALVMYKQNLTSMVEQAQGAKIRVVLLTPTLIEENPREEGNLRLMRYVQAMREVAKEKGCLAIDVHRVFLSTLAKKPADVKGNWLTRDGVHLSDLGDGVMAVSILRGLGVPDEKIVATTNPPPPATQPATKPVRTQPGRPGHRGPR